MGEPALYPEDLNVSQVRLRLWHLAEPRERSERPLVIMLHGMRDVSRSLLPVAKHLTDDYHVVLLDQRGHGASDYPAAYAMEHFYYDLYRVCIHLQAETGHHPSALVGHSLGGQIAARFAGLFPDLLQALVLVEGLGPPDPEWPTIDFTKPLDVERYRSSILERFAIGPQTRSLPSIEFAAERLRLNNPRLSEEQAQQTARFATRVQADASGNDALFWAFDPRVETAFANFSMSDSVALWQAVRCPTLTITGDLSHEYWRGAMSYPENYSGRFQPGEYEARIAHFANIEHQHFEGSGHMVHFDEPARLAQSTLEFLKRNLSDATRELRNGSV